jgi:hypothetical protein
MHLEHTGADGAPLAAIERIERVIVHERASGTIIEGAAARGAQGRDESGECYGDRRSEGNPCPRPANRDTTHAGAIAERACRALAPERISGAADQLPLLRPAQGGGDEALCPAEPLSIRSPVHTDRAHSDDIAKYVAERKRHASRQSLGHRDAHPVGEFAAPQSWVLLSAQRLPAAAASRQRAP